MKLVILPEAPKDAVYLDWVSETTPIFVKEGGRLIGMLVLEASGWIVRMGGGTGGYGFFGERAGCVKMGSEEFGYTFHVED